MPCLANATGGSFSFHAFGVTNSVVEAANIHKRYPERSDVWLIGSDALDQVEQIIDSATDVNWRNLEEIFDFFNSTVHQVMDAADRYNQVADRIDVFCLLGAGCTRLVFDDGFESVNACSGSICFPQPVIFLVYNLDDGGLAQGIYNFATPRGG